MWNIIVADLWPIGKVRRITLFERVLPIPKLQVNYNIKGLIFGVWVSRNCCITTICVFLVVLFFTTFVLIIMLYY